MQAPLIPLNISEYFTKLLFHYVLLIKIIDEIALIFVLPTQSHIISYFQGILIEIRHLSSDK